jgi:hypothetical protein
MRSLQLQSTLTAYVEAVSERLRGELAGGAEIPFELEQQPGSRGPGGPALYCYRPLTVEFIAQRRSLLQALPEHQAAEQLLSTYEGLDRYLAGLGEDVSRLSGTARARAAIGSLLADVFAEQSDFDVRPERLEAALDRLQASALEAASEVTLVATLHGLTIGSPELVLTSGLTIAKLDALEGLPPAVTARGPHGEEHLVVVLRSQEPDPRQAIEASRAVLRDLLRALRLFGDGRVTLGGLGWARVGGSQFAPLPLGEGGRPHGMLVVAADQEDELRAFCNLVSRRAPDGNELAWALARFEMGCARESALQALSDNLLALRALLEPEGPTSGLLPWRLAALCATPDARQSLTERVIDAQSLERAVIAGSARDHAGAQTLATELADHLRALLRDVICGHLDGDLVGLADELLAAEVAPPEPPVAPAMAAQTAIPVPEGAEVRARAVAAPSSDPQLFGYGSEAEEILDLIG